MAPPPFTPLRVLELEGGEGAAHAARFLRDLGAAVTVARAGSGHAAQPALASGKARMQLEPNSPGAAARIGSLAAEFDVVLCQREASEVDSGAWGLSALRALNPRLITAAITPFGESGPHRHWTTSNLVAQQAGGLGYGTPPRVTDPEREPPLAVPGEVVEPLAGLVAVLGVLNAILERDHDGRGRHVEVSMEEAVASLMFNNLAQYIESGTSPGRLASDRPGARRPFLPASDGFLVMMAQRPHHFRAWLELLGEPAKPLLDRLNAGEAPPALARELNEVSDSWTSVRTRREVTDLAQARHIPVEPVLTPAEVLECPQLAARGFWEQSSGEAPKAPGHPFGPAGEGRPRLLPSEAATGEARPWLGLEPGQGPLAGVRVVDFTWVFAGPIATRILAALGATVIKVEEGAAGGPDGRRPFLARVLQGGKHSAYLDLKNEADAAAVRRLVVGADVIVENFSTGVLDRFGLSWAELSSANPGVILASISGMGRTGPYAGHVMLGQLAQAYSGLTSIVGYEGGPPRGIEDGGFWSDPVTGYAAATAILAALRERSVTGTGRRIDVSLVEATVATLFQPLLAAARGDSWSPRGNFHPTMAPHDTYRCAPLDGDNWLAVAVRDDRDWQALCTAIGRPEAAADPIFSTVQARQEHRDELRSLIEAWTRTRSKEEAASALQAAGVPAAPCRTTRDAVEDAHLRERQFFVAGEDGKPATLAMAWRLHPSATLPVQEPGKPGGLTALVREFN